MAKKDNKPVLDDEIARAEGEGMPPINKKFKITAPVSNFKGTRGGVTFTQGVGHTTDAALAGWFAGLGYSVEDAA